MKCSDKFITENKNEISKFIFLFDTPALQADISKYCLRTLKRLGREAVVVDLSPFVNSDVNCCVTAERMSSEVFPVQRIYTKEEFQNFISKHVKGYFYFPLFDDYYGVRLVYRLFSKYKIPYAYINNLNPDVGDAGIPKIIFGSENIIGSIFEQQYIIVFYEKFFQVLMQEFIFTRIYRVKSIIFGEEIVKRVRQSKSVYIPLI